MSGPRRDVRRKRRSYTGLITAIIIVLLAGGVAAYFLLAAPKTVTSMPNVVGQLVSQATTTLHADGLIIGKTHEVSSKKPQYTILSTNPAAEQKIHKGETVTLQVSLGRVTTPVTVPKLVGMTLLEAESTLQQKKLAYTTRLATHGIPDVVLAQIPAWGTKRLTGDTVILIVLAPNGSFPLPSLSGDTVSAASAVLGQYRLSQSQKTGAACSNTQPVGDVVSTVPAAGQLVKANEGIELITSTGACEVLVPYVLGDTSSAAQAAMTSANLVAAFSAAPIGTCPPTEASGTVLTQSVNGGANAPYGSTVDLTVCPGPLSY
jgi:beta-lactam-binding protein with PASTA domain